MATSLRFSTWLPACREWDLVDGRSRAAAAEAALDGWLLGGSAATEGLTDGSAFCRPSSEGISALAERISFPAAGLAMAGCIAGSSVAGLGWAWDGIFRSFEADAASWSLAVGITELWSDLLAGGDASAISCEGAW